jgi:hypothetical protein
LVKDKIAPKVEFNPKKALKFLKQMDKDDPKILDVKLKDKTAYVYIDLPITKLSFYGFNNDNKNSIIKKTGLDKVIYVTADDKES